MTWKATSDLVSAVQNYVVGVDSEGNITLTVGGGLTLVMSIAAAERLRDRLFHVIAREREFLKSKEGNK